MFGARSVEVKLLLAADFFHVDHDRSFAFELAFEQFFGERVFYEVFDRPA